MAGSSDFTKIGPPSRIPSPLFGWAPTVSNGVPTVTATATSAVTVNFLLDITSHLQRGCRCSKSTPEDNLESSAMAIKYCHGIPSKQFQFRARRPSTFIYRSGPLELLRMRLLRDMIGLGIVDVNVLYHSAPRSASTDQVSDAFGRETGFTAR